MQGRTVGDFLRHLKAMFVTGETAQEDGEELPNAFRWEHLGRCSFNLPKEAQLSG